MPINQVSMQFNSIIMALAGAERVFKLLDEQPETDDGYVMLVDAEEKNGESQLVIRLTYDDLNKWKAAKVGNILKCEVPVRVPPVIENDEYANTVKVAK